MRTAAELREAALAGRLASVPGIGPKTERKLVRALQEPQRPARPARTLLLHRALALLEGVAAAIDGEVAGDGAPSP